MKIENLFVSVTISSAWRSPATDLRISEVDAGKLPGSVRETPAMFMERIQMVVVLFTPAYVLSIPRTRFPHD